MSADALERYRALQTALLELRAALVASGFVPLDESTPAEDEILDRMDLAWRDLTENERDLLARERI